MLPSLIQHLRYEARSRNRQVEIEMNRANQYQGRAETNARPEILRNQIANIYRRECAESICSAGREIKRLLVRVE